VLDCLLAPQPQREIRALVLGLIKDSAERRSVRALFTRHYSLLARLVAERNAETGEHYITRTRAAYFDMLRRASGGGVVLAGTTFLKPRPWPPSWARRTPRRAQPPSWTKWPT